MQGQSIGGRFWPYPPCSIRSSGGFRAPCAHRIRDLNHFSRKWSNFEALVHTVPWWRLLGEEVWQGVRAPLGELTCHQCSGGPREDKIQACQHGGITKDVAEAKTRRACTS